MDESQSPAPQRRGVLRRAWRTLPWFIIGWVGLGALLRLTVRDAITGLGFVYYANPPVVMCVLLAVTAPVLFRQRRANAGTVVCVLAVICLLWNDGRDVGLRARSATDYAEGTRIATWNAGRGDAGWDAVAKTIRGIDAHVIALQEAGTDEPDRRAFWAQEFPDHERAFFGSGIILLVRGRIAAQRKIDLQEDAKCALVEVRTDGKILHLLLVDVKRLALTPRDSVFEKLDATIAGIDARPLVVLGDFNTPRQSVFFDSWRETFDHAFEAGGYGLADTWPEPFPVLALDHLWVSRELDVVWCGQPRTAASDHRPVVAHVWLRE